MREGDQTLALELVKKLVPAWDPEHTRATPDDLLDIWQARAEYARGKPIPHEAINWG